MAISPWNFPLAIFTGEVVAALAVGNTVIAKPAEQTSLIAHRAVQLMHEAGVPEEVLQLVLGAGDVGAALTKNLNINGVIFTGSTEVAKLINQSLSAREDLPVLIAETGGQNAMIVDSTALAEQVCADVLNSAFDSAGQRCSALRILCLQEDIADHMVAMIKGAMDELRVDNPMELTTDVGPVIDAEAQGNLLAHIEKMKTAAKSYHQIKLPENADKATFVAPVLFELDNLNQLQREVFGPVLHVVRFRADQLGELIKQINSKGYALTHGIHSRINRTVEFVQENIEAGNIYVNRNIVGAVVGVQPFGGHGLSGTGPKAGGPFYLQKLSAGKAWALPQNLTKLGAADAGSLHILEGMIQQLPISHEEKVRLGGILGEARIHTLNQAVALLQGPTGECNELTWHAPKQVYLEGGSLQQALEGFIRIAATGAQVVVSQDHPLAVLADAAGQLLKVSAYPEQEAKVVHLVSLDKPSAALKTTMAKRDGAILRVIDASNGVDILPLYEEISCSVNTTAAGGNASLMAAAEA